MQLTMKQITVWNGHTQLMFAFSDLSWTRVLFSERLVCTLDHDWLVHYNFSNNRTYILLFSCAYLKCDKEGSSRVFKWVNIPLILYQYISYIVPTFLIRKFLYSYISEASSCLTPWKRFLHYWPFVRRIHRSPVDSPHKEPVMLSFYVYFVARLNKLFCKQSNCGWFDVPWHQCDVTLKRHCLTLA